MMDSVPKHTQENKIHKRVTVGIRSVIAAGLAFEVYERQWLNVTIVMGILLLTLLPSLMARRSRIVIPAEFELLSIAFIFAALFLGETRYYYGRF